MKFNARVSDYSQSGKAVARDFENTFDVARSYSPKADEQVIAADTIRAKEKIAAMKIKGEITSRGIKAAADVKSDKIKTDGEMKYRKSKRKAGVLAAGGQLVADAGDKLGQESRTKRNVGESAEGYAALIETNKTKAEELRTQAEEVDLTGGYKPIELPGSSGPSGSSDSGSSGSTSYTPPKPGKIYNQQELEALAVQGGFSQKDAPLVAKIAMGESSGNPTAFNGKGADQSYGIMQINMLGDMGPERRSQFGLTSNEELYDPLTNMKAAHKIYQQQGWGAWGAYTNGSYNNF
jgi:hypothetical protein